MTEEYIERKIKYFENRPDLKNEYDDFLKSIGKYKSTSLSSSATRKEENKGEFVFFSSERCGFCKKFSPVWDEVVKEYPKANFRKIDKVGNESYFTEYQVSGYPTVIFIVNGEAKSFNVGYKPKEAFKEFVGGTLEGKFTEKQTRNNASKPSVETETRLDSYVLNVNINDWPKVHAKLFTSLQTSPIGFTVVLSGMNIIASFAIKKGVVLPSSVTKYKMV